MVSVAVSADWDCGPRAVDAPRQRHHAQHQHLHSTTAAHQQGKQHDVGHGLAQGTTHLVGTSSRALLQG